MNSMRKDLALAVEQAHRLSAFGRLWPGWDISKTPLVLHGPDIAYVVGHPSPPSGYEPVESVAGRPVLVGPTLPEMAANTARPIAGVL